MNRKSLNASWCPIARSLGRLGDPWTLLILRDTLYGLTRFDEFERSLGIAPNILSRRLKQLVDDGLLERHRYSERPPRDEYRLTQAGRDTRPVALALMAWGNRYLAPEGPSVELVDTQTGEAAQPILVDRISGRPLSDTAFRLAPGPAAPAAIRSRFDAAAKRHLMPARHAD